MATKFSAPTSTHHDALPAAGQRTAVRSGKPWQLDEEIQLAAADEAVAQAAPPAAEATTSIPATAATESAATEAATVGASTEGSLAATGAAATSTAAATATGVSPWAIGGGVLGVAAIAAAAGGSSGSKGSSDNISQGDKSSGTQPPASTAPGNTTPDTGNAPPAGSNDTPPAAETPADPTRPSVTVAHDNAANPLDKSLFGHSIANTQQIRIDKIDAAEGSDLDVRIYRDHKIGGVDHHTAYEVIKVDGDGITWEQAKAHAERLGGRLLVIDDVAEAEFLAANLSSRLGDTPSEFAGLAKGSWVGLSQDPNATAADAGWYWDAAGGRHAFTAADWASFGTTLAGHGKLPSDGATPSGNAEAHKADHGAIIAAYQLPTNGEPYGTFAKTMLFDHGGKLNSFVIEYDNYQSPLKLAGAGNELVNIVDGQIISADKFDTIRWDSVLNNGGKITYTAVDSTESSAKPVEGARQVTITISEQAAQNAATADGSHLDSLLGISHEQLLLLG